MNKAYNRINWENYPSDSTPLNEDNLNKMDVAINEVDNRVISLDTTKLPVATAYTMVKDVAFDEKTGIFTITKLNGSVIKINTALEKIATNFRFDHSTQKLILTLIDGTTQEVDLSALLTQYEFLNSSTIQFTIDSSGKVKASVVNGSITGDMLEPNYLANVTLQASKADTSAKNAKESEEKAAEYAESAKNSADSAEPVASTATGINPTIQDSTNAPLIYGKFKGYTLQNGEPTPDNPVEINGLAKGGAIEVGTTGILGEETTASIPTDVPLYEGDYLEVYADGSGEEYRNMTHISVAKSDFVKITGTDNIYYQTSAKYPKDAYGTQNNKTGLMYCNLSSDITNPDNPGGGRAWVATISGSNGALVRISTDVYEALADTQNVEFVYKLATPTETSLTAEQVEQFKQLYTFKPITNVFCDGEVEMIYLKNTNGGKALASVRRGVEHADTANTATKATQDGNGNVIAETYYRKTNFDKIVGGTVEPSGKTNVAYSVPTEVSSKGVVVQTTTSGTLINALSKATASISSFFSTVYEKVTDNFATKSEVSTLNEVLTARMDSFTKLEEGSTTGDAELVDARIDYLGTTHENVGEHMRTVTKKIADVSENFSIVDGMLCVAYENE